MKFIVTRYETHAVRVAVEADDLVTAIKKAQTGECEIVKSVLDNTFDSLNTDNGITVGALKRKFPGVSLGSSIFVMRDNVRLIPGIKDVELPGLDSEPEDLSVNINANSNAVPFEEDLTQYDKISSEVHTALMDVLVGPVGSDARAKYDARFAKLRAEREAAVAARKIM